MDGVVLRKNTKTILTGNLVLNSKHYDTNFYLDSRQNSNMDTSHMTEEEIVTLNTQLYEDYYKNVPVRW